MELPFHDDCWVDTGPEGAALEMSGLLYSNGTQTLLSDSNQTADWLNLEPVQVSDNEPSCEPRAAQPPLTTVQLLVSGKTVSSTW